MESNCTVFGFLPLVTLLLVVVVVVVVTVDRWCWWGMVKGPSSSIICCCCGGGGICWRQEVGSVVMVDVVVVGDGPLERIVPVQSIRAPRATTTLSFGEYVKEEEEEDEEDDDNEVDEEEQRRVLWVGLLLP
jgi:hypothetical protein